MEKKLTIRDVFYFVNQAMEHDADLRTSRFYSSAFWISCNEFDIICAEDNKTIIIQTDKLDDINLNITNMEAAQFRVLWEKVKEYSENKAVDSFLNYFNQEKDNSEKTIDDIDD